MSRFERQLLSALLLSIVAAFGCGRSQPPAGPPAAAVPTPVAPAPEPPGLEPAPEATPLPAGMAPILAPFKGDLDGMLKRRLVRLLTVQNPVLYFVDRGREAGMTYEAAQAFEQQLNRSLGSKVVKVHVLVIPVPRDQLIPRLLSGEGDIAAATLTVTPQRQKLVDFGAPLASGVHEVLVTGPGAPEMTSLEDLSGKQIYVRRSSSYAEHLEKLNAHFAKLGKPGVEIVPADEVLEDGDILEMVNAGLVPATVVDDYMADLYLQVFPALKKHDAIASPPGEIAWAFRKGSPKLKAAVNAFVRTHKEGSLAGNVLVNKYLKTTKWVKNARSDEDRRRFQSMIELFRRYGSRYDLDALLMIAQGYQESGLDQSKRSRVGAIGVMQVMPATARDKAVNIPDIEKLDSNIHAGIKYNRWVIDNFYRDPKMSRLNRELFAFASYNAGPGRIASLRREAKASGLDPDVWFNNVELVAAKRIGRETVTYVANIYKYYLAYQLMLGLHEERQQAKQAAAKR